MSMKRGTTSIMPGSPAGRAATSSPGATAAVTSTASAHPAKRAARRHNVGTPQPAAPPGLAGASSARPQMPGDPGAGCTTDDLRAFVLDQLAEMKEQHQALELNVADQLNGRLQDHESVARDVLNMKNDLKEFQATNEARLQHANTVMEELNAKLAMFESTVAQDVSRSMEAIEKIAAIEQDLENRVKITVKKMEHEIMSLHYLISESKTDEDFKGTGSMKLTQMQFEIAGIRAEYRKEMSEVKGALQVVRASCEKFLADGGGGNPGAGAGDSAQAESGRKYPCHCNHLDLLDGRVIVLENLLQATQNGHGFDPWYQPRAAADAPRHDPAHAAGDGHGGSFNGESRARPDLSGYNLNRLFDDKIPLSAEYQYDGEKNGDRWAKKVRGYFLSKCSDLLPIFDWINGLKEGEEITPERLTEEAKSCRWMIDADVKKLDELLWGFLNTALQGVAHTCFENAEELQGFEGWRIINEQITHGKAARMGNLRKLVKNPPRISKLEDIDHGITSYDNLLKAFKTAGGTIPGDDDLKQDLVDMLPVEIREQLLWRADNKLESYSAFKNHVRQAATNILYHRGKLTSNVFNVNADDHHDHDDISQEAIDWGADETVAAVARWFKGKGKGKSSQGGGHGPPSAPAGKAAGKGNSAGRTLMCTNCGSDKHAIDRCPKPRVAVQDRPCYGCGKTGHVRAQCPERKAIKNVDEELSLKDVFFGCMMDGKDAPWSTVPSRRHPMPRRSTLGDFWPTETRNSFMMLDEDDSQDVSRASSSGSGADEINDVLTVKEMKAKKKEKDMQTKAEKEERTDMQTKAKKP